MSNNGPRIYVFYAGLLHSTWNVFPRYNDLGPEVYNGCWIWVAQHWLPHGIFKPVGWYLADRTPCLMEDVPPEMKVLALLLT